MTDTQPLTALMTDFDLQMLKHGAESAGKRAKSVLAEDSPGADNSGYHLAVAVAETCARFYEVIEHQAERIRTLEAENAALRAEREWKPTHRHTRGFCVEEVGSFGQMVLLKYEDNIYEIVSYGDFCWSYTPIEPDESAENAQKENNGIR